MRFGDYEIVSQIATGGMSEVFLARRDGAGEEPLVIKRILPGLAQDERFVELFAEEARISSLMNHPNVVRIFDSGIIDEQPYLAMEFVDGLDCWRMVHRCARLGAPPPPRSAIFITCEVLRALAHVHTASDEDGQPMAVVHGDVSPTNIYISRRGEVKLGDFGIARARHRDLVDSKSKLHGKVAYLAPEQVVGGDVDHRADIFAVGTVLTELLIQTRLFGGGSQLTTLLSIRDARLDVLEANIEKIPEGVVPILRKALSKDRNARFPTAMGMCRLLERQLGGASTDELRGELAELVERALAADLDDGLEPKPTGEPEAHGRDDTNPLALRDDDAGPLGFDLGLDDPDWSVPSLEPTPPPVLEPTPAPVKLSRIADDEQLVQEEEGLDIEVDVEVDLDGFDDELDDSLRETQQPVEEETRYTFRKADGRVLGPFTRIAAIEKVIADQIRSHYEVSINNGPYQPLSEVRELARHAPSLTPVTTELDSIGPPDRRGILCDEEPVWAVLYELANARETGLMLFDHGVVRKEVYLREGQLHYVSSNVSSELLGRSLVEKNVITQGQLDLALQHLGRFNNHLGDALVGLGVLDSISLFRYIQGQVQDKLFDVFGWKDGEYMLYRGVEDSDVAFPLHIDIIDILWPGICHGVPDREAGEWLEAREEWTITPASAPHAIRGLRLPEALESVLTAINRPMTLRLVTRMTGDWNMRFDLARAVRYATDVGLFDLHES